MTARLVAVVSLAVLAGLAQAVQAANSTSYRIDESFIGGGGLTTESSTNFSAGETIGDVVGGSSPQTASTNFQVNTGSQTTADPGLTFIVNTASVNFGALSTSVATTATSSFSVKNYTSSGYIVQIVGAPPSNGSHSLTGLSPKAPSQVGTEQFGINLVANASPISFGANPVQVPSGSFSYGVVEAGDGTTTGYGMADNYRYASGETIAKSLQTSGETDFTISYMVNAATTTPAGSYTGSEQLICTATY